MKSVEYPQLCMLFLEVPTSQLISHTQKPKWIINEHSNQPGPHNFYGSITIQFQIV